MKNQLLGVLLVTTLYTHLSNAQLCTFCESGITNPTVVVPVANRTCSEIPPIIADTLEDSTLCTAVKQAEELCCPGGQNVVDEPCTFCEGGIPNPDLVVKNQTCAEIEVFASELTSDDELCAAIQSEEWYVCCPNNSSPPTPSMTSLASASPTVQSLTSASPTLKPTTAEATLSPTTKQITSSPTNKLVTSTPTGVIIDSAPPAGKGVISGKAFYDSNTNGNYDALLEYGIFDITASLYSCDGDDSTPLSTTTTDTQGTYKFENLAEGQYYIKFQYPGYYMLGSSAWNGDDTTPNVDNSANPDSGATNCFTLADGGEFNKANVGLVYNPNPTPPTPPPTPPPTLAATTLSPTKGPTVAPTQASPTSSPTATSCTFCEGGLPDLTLNVPGTAQNCGEVKAIAADVVNGSDICKVFQDAETVCCPKTTDSEPCVICKDGIPDANLLLSGAGGFTCGEVIALAEKESANSGVCSYLRNVESSCCPPSFDNPCQFCEDGIPKPDFEIVGTGQTCASMKLLVADEQNDSGVCVAVQQMESSCCPGPDANTSTPTPLPTTLKAPTAPPTLKPSTSTLEPTITVPISLSPTPKPQEEIITPPPISEENRCHFCELGMIDDALEIPGRNGQTCGLLKEQANTVNGRTPLCRNIQLAEDVCCPEPTNNSPCTFCEDGIVNIDLELQDGYTCGTVNALAVTVQQDDSLCAQVQLAESLCCPPPQPPTQPPVEEPPPTQPPVEESASSCTFCPQGIAKPDLEIVEAGGQSCQSLQIVSSTFEADSDLCFRIQLVQDQCCPSSEGGPPSSEPAPTVSNPTPPLPASTPTFAPSTKSPTGFGIGVEVPLAPLPSSSVGPITTRGIKMLLTGVGSTESYEKWQNVTADFILDYFKNNTEDDYISNVNVIIVMETETLEVVSRKGPVRRLQQSVTPAVKIQYTQVTSFTAKYPESYAYDENYIAEEPFKKDPEGYIAMLKAMSSYYDPVTAVTVTAPRATVPPPSPPLPAPVKSPTASDNTSTSAKYIIIGVVCAVVLVALVVGIIIVRKRKLRRQDANNRSFVRRIDINEDLESRDIGGQLALSVPEGQVMVHVICPSGKLGVVVDNPREGGSVHVTDLREDSPVLGQVHIGDTLIAVDDDDVQQLSAFDVSKLLAARSRNPRRKLTILRPDGEGEVPFSNRAINPVVAPSSTQDKSVERSVTIIAPSGKLGVVFENTPGGGSVHVCDIREGSVLEGQIQLKDVIISIDDEDVRGLKAFHVSKMLASNSQNRERKIVVLRREAVGEGSGDEEAPSDNSSTSTDDNSTHGNNSTYTDIE
jgi:hypothetical protein